MFIQIVFLTEFIFTYVVENMYMTLLWNTKDILKNIPAVCTPQWQHSVWVISQSTHTCDDENLSRTKTEQEVKQVLHFINNETAQQN